VARIFSFPRLFARLFIRINRLTELHHITSRFSFSRFDPDFLSFLPLESVGEEKIPIAILIAIKLHSCIGRMTNYFDGIKWRN